jgi:hypothetical protein
MGSVAWLLETALSAFPESMFYRFAARPTMLHVTPACLASQSALVSRAIIFLKRAIHEHEEINGRGSRHILADVRAPRQRRHRRLAAKRGYRLPRRFTGYGLLTGVTMAYAIGHISGCHLTCGNIGLGGGRALSRQSDPSLYHRAGGWGVIGGAVPYFIASGKAGFDLTGGFASNGYGDYSPCQYSLLACLVAEFVLPPCSCSSSWEPRTASPLLASLH